MFKKLSCGLLALTMAFNSAPALMSNSANSPIGAVDVFADGVIYLVNSTPATAGGTTNVAFPLSNYAGTSAAADPGTTWVLTTRASGSSLTENASITTFTPDAAGDYVLTASWKESEEEKSTTLAIAVVDPTTLSAITLPDELVDIEVGDTTYTEVSAVTTILETIDISSDINGDDVSLSATADSTPTWNVNTVGDYVFTLTLTGDEADDYAFADGSTSLNLTVKTVDTTPTLSVTTAEVNENAEYDLSAITNGNTDSSATITKWEVTTNVNSSGSISGDVSTGYKFTGTEEGVYTLTATFSDDATATLEITVKTVDTTPTLSVTTAEVNENAEYDLSTITNGNTDSSATITKWEVTTNVNSSGSISGDVSTGYKFTGTEEGVYTLTATFSDDATATLEITVKTVDTTPTLSVTTTEVNVNAEYDLSAITNGNTDSSATITKWEVTTNVNSSGSISSDKFTGTEEGVYTLTATFSDDATATLEITVTEAGSTKTTLTLTESTLTVDNGATIAEIKAELDALVDNVAAGDTLTYTWDYTDSYDATVETKQEVTFTLTAVSGTNSENYNLPTSPAVAVTISAKPAATITNVTVKPYGTESIKDFTYSTGTVTKEAFEDDGVVKDVTIGATFIVYLTSDDEVVYTCTVTEGLIISLLPSGVKVETSGDVSVDTSELVGALSDSDINIDGDITIEVTAPTVNDDLIKNDITGYDDLDNLTGAIEGKTEITGTITEITKLIFPVIKVSDTVAAVSVNLTVEMTIPEPESAVYKLYLLEITSTGTLIFHELIIDENDASGVATINNSGTNVILPYTAGSAYTIIADEAAAITGAVSGDLITNSGVTGWAASLKDQTLIFTPASSTEDEGKVTVTLGTGGTWTSEDGKFYDTEYNVTLSGTGVTDDVFKDTSFKISLTDVGTFTPAKDSSETYTGNDIEFDVVEAVDVSGAITLANSVGDLSDLSGATLTFTDADDDVVTATIAYDATAKTAAWAGTFWSDSVYDVALSVSGADYDYSLSTSDWEAENTNKNIAVTGTRTHDYKEVTITVNDLDPNGNYYVYLGTGSDIPYGTEGEDAVIDEDGTASFEFDNVRYNVTNSTTYTIYIYDVNANIKYSFSENGTITVGSTTAVPTPSFTKKVVYQDYNSDDDYYYTPSYPSTAPAPSVQVSGVTVGTVSLSGTITEVENNVVPTIPLSASGLTDYSSVTQLFTVKATAGTGTYKTRISGLDTSKRLAVFRLADGAYVWEEVTGITLTAGAAAMMNNGLISPAYSVTSSSMELTFPMESGYTYAVSQTIATSSSGGSSSGGSSFSSAVYYNSGSVRVNGSYITELRNVLVGELVNLSKITTVNGQTVQGWYYDSAMTNEITNTSQFVITSDVIANGLYAKTTGTTVVPDSYVDGSTNAGNGSTTTPNSTYVPSVVPSTVAELLGKLF